MVVKRMHPGIISGEKRDTTNPLGNILKDPNKRHKHMGKVTKPTPGKDSSKSKTKAAKRPSRVGDVFVDYPPENEYDIKLRIVEWVDES